MKKDDFITEVQFRKLKGEIIAVFPYSIWSYDDVTSYQHIGQHGGASWNINTFTTPAKEPEYINLLLELGGLGYNVKVIKRRNHAKYLKAYHKYVEELQAIF